MKKKTKKKIPRLTRQHCKRKQRAITGALVKRAGVSHKNVFLTLIFKGLLLPRMLAPQSNLMGVLRT